VVVVDVLLVLLLPPQPLRLKTPSKEHASASSNSEERHACLRLRSAHPNGMSSPASTSPDDALPKPGRSSAAVVMVETVSVVLCAVLLPVKLSVVGAKLQVAAVGRVPQAKVTVPV
jgi:hypothetical protein